MTAVIERARNYKSRVLPLKDVWGGRRQEILFPPRSETLTVVPIQSELLQNDILGLFLSAAPVFPDARSHGMRNHEEYLFFDVADYQRALLHVRRYIGPETLIDLSLIHI